MGNWRTQLHTGEKMRNGTRKHRRRQPVGRLKKTGFPGSENWRDVPQLTFLFQALMHDMVNYFLPCQCTVHKVREGRHYFLVDVLSSQQQKTCDTRVSATFVRQTHSALRPNNVLMGKVHLFHCCIFYSSQIIPPRPPLPPTN